MILTIDELPGKLCDWSEPRIVLSHGCFDLLHIGHIRHLEQAKRLGDLLVVTITADRFVGKGSGRPIFDENIRAECVNALRCVDYVAINPQKHAPIATVLPQIYAKGCEYRNNMTDALRHEQSLVESVGGALVFTDGDECHTTEITDMIAGRLPLRPIPAQRNLPRYIEIARP